MSKYLADIEDWEKTAEQDATVANAECINSQLLPPNKPNIDAA